MKKYFVEIDILKGIAIGMVILGHSIISFPINLNTMYSWCGFLHNLVSSVHMPLFFAISGFCFSFKNWKDFLAKKTRRILIPYIAFSLIGIIPNILFPHLVNKPLSIQECLLGMLYGKNFWFLYVLMIIFIIFPFIDRYVKGIFSWLFMSVIILLYLLIPFDEISNGYIVIEYFSKYIIFFYGGYLVKRYFDLIQCGVRNIKQKTPFVIGLLFFAWIGTTFLYVQLKGRDNAITKMSILAVAVIGILFWVFFVEQVKNNSIINNIKKYGKVSLQLYLFQGYFLTIGRTITVKMLHVSNPVVIIAFNFLLMYFISYTIIQYIVKRVALFRILTGMV